MMKVHDMKLNTRWFDEVAAGEKNYEIRKDDRGGFSAGDVLVLREVDYNDNDVVYYTGRIVTAKVTHVITHEQFPDGLKKGYAVLGLGKPAVVE